MGSSQLRWRSHLGTGDVCGPGWRDESALIWRARIVYWSHQFVADAVPSNGLSVRVRIRVFAGIGQIDFDRFPLKFIAQRSSLNTYPSVGTLSSRIRRPRACLWPILRNVSQRVERSWERSRACGSVPLIPHSEGRDTVGCCATCRLVSSRMATPDRRSPSWLARLATGRGAR